MCPEHLHVARKYEVEKNTNVNAALQAARAIVEGVPIYQDALQPAAREIGKGLQTVAKTVHIALAPVAALVWGYEQVKEFLATAVAEKLRGVPEDQIITPDLQVAGPALEALRFVGPQDELREMFAKLLAAAMSRDSAHLAHPSYTEVIKSMTPDEARIVSLFTTRWDFPVVHFALRRRGDKGRVIFSRNFSNVGEMAGCQYPSRAPIYLDNLIRLRLVTIPDDTYLTNNALYEPLEQGLFATDLKRHVELSLGSEFVIVRAAAFPTQYGREFAKLCAPTPVAEVEPGARVGTSAGGGT